MSISGIAALLQQGARADLMKIGEGQKSGLVEALCDRLPSSARTEYLPFLGEAPQLTKHDLGDMTTSSPIKDVAFSVENETFRSKLSIRREDLEDDLTGGIRLRIQQMLRVGMGLEDKLLIAAIEGSQLGFDGVAMFSDSHVNSYSTEAIAHDNLLAGGGTGTAALIQADFSAAVEKAMSYTGGNGEPWNEGNMNEIHVLAPWGIRQTVLEGLATDGRVTESALVSGLNLKIHFSARLTDANNYFVFVTGAQKPFYLFDRKPLTVYTVEDDAEGIVHVVAEKRLKLANGHYAHGAKIVNA